MLKKAQVIRVAALYRRRLVAKLRRAYHRETSPAAKQALRLAMLWVQADSISDMGAGIILWDQMARVEVLAGALKHSDSQVRRMINKPVRVLKNFQKEMPGTVDPKWFQKGDTGMFRILWSNVSKVMHGQEATAGRTTSDIVTDLMMGMAKQGGTRTMPLVEAGKQAAPNIFSGKDKPENIGAGIGGAIFARAAKSEAKTTSRRQRIEDEAEEAAGATMVYDEEGVADVAAPVSQDDMTDIALKAVLDKRDPLGKKILMIGRMVAKANTKDGKYKGWGPLLDAWLNTVEAGDPNWAEAARVLGKAPTGINKQKQVAFETMWRTVAADRKLMKEIETRHAIQSGVGRYASIKTRKEAALRRQLVRLASQRPDLRSVLLPLLQQG